MLCRICGQAARQAFDVREMMFGCGDRFTYFQCGQCLCLQIAEVPADLSPYYPANYYSYTHSPVELIKNPLKRMLRRTRDHYAVFDRGLVGRFLYHRFPNEPLRSLSGVNDLTRASRVLDVGCGSGSTLFSLKEMGFRSLLGIDPYLDRDIEYENGLQILKKRLAEVSGKWDLVMFHHSFEHTPDPLGLLRTAARLLAAGGACLIRMPTLPSHVWDHYSVNWVQLDAPRHCFIHSPKSMEHLAQQASLELTRIVYDSTAFQFWGSEQYVRDIPLTSERSYAINPGRSIFSKEQIASFAEQAHILNREGRGDAAAFYLQRRA